MKKIIVFLTILISPTFATAEEKKINCDSVLSKLKPSCSLGDPLKALKKFSSKHKTLGQTLGIKTDGKDIKSLKKFSKENKTIDQTIRNMKEKKNK
jgi:hypothetical protein